MYFKKLSNIKLIMGNSRACSFPMPQWPPLAHFISFLAINPNVST